MAPSSSLKPELLSLGPPRASPGHHGVGKGEQPGPCCVFHLSSPRGRRGKVDTGSGLENTQWYFSVGKWKRGARGGFLVLCRTKAGPDTPGTNWWAGLKTREAG